MIEIKTTPQVAHSGRQRRFSSHSVLDYSKAFDRVNYNFLLEKLKSNGISPFLVSWFTSFLTRRSQYVRLGDFFIGYSVFVRRSASGCFLWYGGFLALIDDLKPALPLL